jgi:hypothetical protein
MAEKSESSQIDQNQHGSGCISEHRLPEKAYERLCTDACKDDQRIEDYIDAVDIYICGDQAGVDGCQEPDDCQRINSVFPESDKTKNTAGKHKGNGEDVKCSESSYLIEYIPVIDLKDNTQK